MGDLSNAKVGDILVIDPGRSRNDRHLAKVTRLTKRYVVCGEVRFHHDGRRVGESAWAVTNASLATPEDIEALRIAKERRNLAAKLRNMDWPSLSLDVLRDVERVVKAAQEYAAENGDGD